MEKAQLTTLRTRRDDREVPYVDRTRGDERSLLSAVGAATLLFTT